VAANNTDLILSHLERYGFEISDARFMQLTHNDAAEFYAEHRDKPFFVRLATFMTMGPVIVVALEREDAVAELRRVIGATDPTEADPGTIRKLYATDKTRNAIHASDSEASAERELAFFFNSRDPVNDKS
jgi:nucleoside-diphosphate kinase